ncbi:olfactory receptor 52K2-like [Megalops cyprinoides]|uniref:olfactory receptor 52K2-like n=1 Tax=Megalops cyprinoides TaxID=118141 RepID=UPI001864BD02|nr:olfactory receptor 52K2-like [Megalops cyprinoides]
MANVSLVPLEQPIVFKLEGFIVSKETAHLLFVLSLFGYLAMLTGNGIVAIVILIEKTLHKPMYIMVCNLLACDLLGGTAMMTRLMSDFLSEERTITYVAAIFQAFSMHTYGSAIQTILSVMAYDRYIAICEPLRYYTIMTTGKLIGLCLLAWIIALVLVLILFMLNVTVPLCGTLIVHVYCSNRSIMRLACIPTPINDIYGLVMTWVLSTGSFLVIAFSYIKILIACLVTRKNESKRKAIQTCAPHLIAYIIFEITSMIIIMSYRVEQISENMKKFFAILSMILPPLVNPIIYGMVMKNIRINILKLFQRKVFPNE